MTGPAEAYGRFMPITGDTQMTLFTAEGLLRALVAHAHKGGAHPVEIVDHAYARWLLTQGEQSPRWPGDAADGWLVHTPGLHERRAPGNTRLAGLRAPVAGSIERPGHASKGCGGVMRAAPAGLTLDRFGPPFELGAELAALTHGHAAGHLAAGCLAHLVSELVRGRSLDEARYAMEIELRLRPDHRELLETLCGAYSPREDAGPETIAEIGEGWVADEALAIAIHCALSAPDLRTGLLLAVNHGGDSDSTGAIAGSILGAMYGASAIPGDWLASLELRETIEELVEDWIAAFADGADVTAKEWALRYPGW